MQVSVHTVSKFEILVTSNKGIGGLTLYSKSWVVYICS